MLSFGQCRASTNYNSLIRKFLINKEKKLEFENYFKTAMLYPELSNRILGIAMQLHREMGCGFKEKVYQDAFEVLLKENNITYEKE